MKWYLYLAILLITAASMLVGDQLVNLILIIKANYKLLIDKYYVLFTLGFIFVAVLLSQAGFSFGILLAGFVALSNSLYSYLIAFALITVSGVLSYFWLKRLPKSDNNRLIEKWKNHKLSSSPYFAYIIRLIPGLPFMVQNIIITETGIGFQTYMLSLNSVSFLYLSLVYAIFNLI